MAKEKMKPEKIKPGSMAAYLFPDKTHFVLRWDEQAAKRTIEIAGLSLRGDTECESC